MLKGETTKEYIETYNILNEFLMPDKRDRVLEYISKLLEYKKAYNYLLEYCVKNNKDK